MQCKINKGCGEQDGIRVADFQGSVQEEGRTKGRRVLIEDRKNRIVYISACQKKRERERKEEDRGHVCLCVSACVRYGTEMDHQRLYLLRGHA